MKRIAIFASGSGSNAQNIIEFFKRTKSAKVEILLTNNKDAYVIERVGKYQIRTCIFDRKEFYQTDNIVNLLSNMNIDIILLAGFLWLVPLNLLNRFPNRIVNLHPALLPKYGGKGMYGNKVYEAVIAGGEKFSGITVHFVNEYYDQGDIIFQKKFELLPHETIDSLSKKVHALEYEFFPVVIDNLLKTLI